SSRRRHTRFSRDWSSDVCSSDLYGFKFTTDSDTEVLLIAWQYWGIAVLREFVGMFSFVIFDKIKNKITFARDAFGIKPFFYCIENKNIFFGSDICGLLKLTEKKPKPNLQKAYDY